MTASHFCQNIGKGPATVKWNHNSALETIRQSKQQETLHWQTMDK